MAFCRQWSSKLHVAYSNYDAQGLCPRIYYAYNYKERPIRARSLTAWVQIIYRVYDFDREPLPCLCNVYGSFEQDLGDRKNSSRES